MDNCRIAGHARHRRRRHDRVARREIVAGPFDDGPPQYWSLSALSVAGTALTFLEPDPHAPEL